jgi:hypothetical protein
MKNIKFSDLPDDALMQQYHPEDYYGTIDAWMDEPPN